MRTENQNNHWASTSNFQANYSDTRRINVQKAIKVKAHPMRLLDPSIKFLVFLMIIGLQSQISWNRTTSTEAWLIRFFHDGSLPGICEIVGLVFEQKMWRFEFCMWQATWRPSVTLPRSCPPCVTSETCDSAKDKLYSSPTIWPSSTNRLFSESSFPG